MPIDAPAQAAALAAARVREVAGRDLPPVTVVWEGEPASVLLTLTDPPRTDRLLVDVEVEGGEPIAREHRLGDLDVVRGRTVDGVPMTTRRVPLARELPPGYHRVRLDYGCRPAEGLVIAAPRRAYTPLGAGERLWGVFVPLYALHSGRSIGGGDFTDLERLTAWLGEIGGGVVGTLPLLAAFLDEPCEPSPFVPVSRQHWTELYIDLDRVPEVELSGTAGRMARGKRFARDAAALRRLDEVDHRRQMALLRQVLEPCAKHLFTHDSPRRRALERFVAEHPTLSDYAAFRAMGETARTPWQTWPARQREGTLLEGDYDEAAYRYHLYVQWLAHGAVTELARTAEAHGPGLYLDLPVGVHPDGFDAWRERELYTEGISVGAPPDGLAPSGQDWGFPALVPDASREDFHRHVTAYVRHHAATAGVLRIDHVMGLHRLFYVPRGMPGTHGVYVRNRPEELYAILCLESVRNETMLIGEDLGTVPPAVRPAMDRHGLLRSHVVQSAVVEDVARAFESVPRGAVATMNTHDMPPFAGFWAGRDVERFGEIGTIPPERLPEVRSARDRLRRRYERHLLRTAGVTAPVTAREALDASLEALAASDAALVLVTLEDLWLEERFQNVPGTTDESNWRRKLRVPLETIESDPDVRDLLARIDARRARAPQEPLRTAGGGDLEAPGGRVFEVLPEGSAELAASGGGTTDRRDADDRGGGSDVAITPEDIYLFAEGNHLRLHAKLGAHVVEEGGERGTRFAVWAPGARSVSVFGSFNGWSKTAHPLRRVDETSGIWVTFVAGVAPGAHYKFHIVSRVGRTSGDKADPFAFATEEPPKTASIVAEPDAYAWGDGEWLEGRAARQALDAPMSTYEVHLGSWRRANEDGGRSLTYRELAEQLPRYVRSMGYTHVELMPVMEHPFYGSWGYQVTGYFAPTARQGPPEGLMALIDALHQEGIGVVLDWVPSHFPTDAHGLGFFDGTHLFEHADPRQGFHPDWKSFIFNYNRGEVVSFLLSNALFWLERYHVDALRVDAVASMLYRDYSRKEGEWEPNVHGGRENLEAIDFLKRLNRHVGERFPGALMIAEESTAWPMVTQPPYLGGLGFHLKWDMGWMHDTLEYMQMDPLFRSHHHHKLTFRGVYASTENFVLALSHDEVVHGKRSLLAKMPGDWWKQFASLRALYGYMYGLPGKKLLFMGGELGQWTEWNHDGEVDWALEQEPMHRALMRWVADLNTIYRTEPALHQRDTDPAGFAWIDCNDNSGSTLTFLRKGERESTIVVACNFTPVPHDEFRIGVPVAGFWREILNGDDTDYGGSGVVNPAGLETTDVASHGQPHTLSLTLPPLAVVFLKAPEGAGG